MSIRRNSNGDEFLQLIQQQSDREWHHATTLEFTHAPLGHCARFSPDSSHIAVAHGSNIRVHSTGGPLVADVLVLDGGTGDVLYLDYNPAGTLLACWCDTEPASP